MNYFQLHIGDYEKATAHLTAVEDGVYNRLLRRYYDTEQPIPADIKAVQRLVRARSKDEREAVETVLEEFFSITPDGWRHGRCDEEITAFHGKKDKARASANARWKRDSGNANASPDDMRTHSERNANAPETHSERNANQEPLTKKEQKQKAAAVPPVDFRADLFARWKSLPDGGGGAFLNKLFRDHKPEQRVMEAVEHTLDETRADPKAYVQRVLSTRAKAEDAYDALMARAV